MEASKEDKMRILESMLTKNISDDYSIEKDIIGLQKIIGKPISEIVYYRHLTLKEKMEYIDKLYQKAKEEMKDPICKDDPSRHWIVSSMIRGWNVEKAKDDQEHSCICCGIGTVPKYRSFSYLLKPHRIVYGFVNGDYIPPNIVMLCHKCHDKEFDYWTKNKKRLQTIKIIKHKRGTTPMVVPIPWDELVDTSFDIFKEFIAENHEHTDTEIENDIFQEIELDIP